MTDQDALLDAIFAAPDDDAPRLVYADWLDEHGDPEQAEFIRLQIELSRTPVSDSSWRPKVDLLELCWEPLRVRHQARFPNTELRLSVFSRGLPDQPLRIRGYAFIRDSPSWWPSLPIRTVELTDWADYIHAICHCSYLRRLADLSLQDNTLGYEAAKLLVASDHVHCLKSLRVSARRLSPRTRELLRTTFSSRFRPEL